MTELPDRVRAQVDAALVRRTRKARARAALDEARQAGLARRRADRMARALESCPSCGVPDDAVAHWPGCTQDPEEGA